MTKSEFIQAATAAAQKSSAASGLPAGVTVAQAALESNWGQSRLSRECNNYFGIKAHRGAASHAFATTEYCDGKALNARAMFAGYASIDDCFADRDCIICTVPIYQDALAARDDPEAFIRALARHWATDPHYADKLLAIYRANSFDKVDQPHPAPRHRDAEDM